MKSTWYITTTLPYVNADPHIGFALEIIQADVLARHARMLGKSVTFNTGTDEHGIKILRKAQEQGMDPQTYVDGYAASFAQLKELLNLTYSKFIRTTDEHHKKAAQELWRRCKDNGYIYKKQYETKYCVGCELEKTDSELVDGQCPLHPTYEIERIDEENYFFAFSKFEKELLALYDQDGFVLPEEKRNEIRAFVSRGLQDFSISRLKEKMPWGVEVPDDEDHTMYVWFDALTNYISTIGWPTDATEFEANWPGIQVAGKDNLRQQTAIWQAMLLAAGLPPAKQVFIHGFITSEGQKMSKSIGNVVNPKDIVEEYGTDAVRNFLIGGLPSYDDGDFSRERFETFYTAHLANGIGNLTSRVITMIEKYADGVVPSVSSEPLFDTDDMVKRYDAFLHSYGFQEAVTICHQLVSIVDESISVVKPWEKAKAGEDISVYLAQLVEALRIIAVFYYPIIPKASETIFAQLNLPDTHANDEHARTWGNSLSGVTIHKGEPLFPRLAPKA